MIVAWQARAPVGNQTAAGGNNGSSAITNSDPDATGTGVTIGGGEFIDNGSGYFEGASGTTEGYWGTTRYAQAQSQHGGGGTSYSSSSYEFYATIRATSTAETVSEGETFETTTTYLTDSSTSYFEEGSGGTPDGMIPYVSGTMTSNFTSTIDVSITTTLSWEIPTHSSSTTGSGTNTGWSRYSTTTSTSYSQITETTSTTLRSQMVEATAEAPADAAELHSPTYYPAPGEVVWILTAESTVGGLPNLEDIAVSTTGSFTLDEHTSAEAQMASSTGPLTTHALLQVTEASSGLTTYTSYTQGTAVITITTFSIGSLSNTTGTTTAYETVSTTYQETTVVQSLASDTLSPLFAQATQSTMRFATLMSTTTIYQASHDSQGRSMGFVLLTVSTTVATTFTDKAAWNLFSYSSSDANFTEYLDQGATVVKQGLHWGFVPADTGSMTRFDPARPGGVVAPRAKISERRPHYELKVGDLKFPALYAIGQRQDNDFAGHIYAPLPLQGETTATATESDSSTYSYSISWSSYSVTLLKAGGTAGIVTTAMGSLTEVGVITDEYWRNIGDVNLYGGVMNDGRAQKLMFPRMKLDVTAVGTVSGAAGSISDNLTPSTSEANSSDGVNSLYAFNYIPVWTPVLGAEDRFLVGRMHGLGAIQAIE